MTSPRTKQHKSLWENVHFFFICCYVHSSPMHVRLLHRRGARWGAGARVWRPCRGRAQTGGRTGKWRAITDERNGNIWCPMTLLFVDKKCMTQTKKRNDFRILWPQQVYESDTRYGVMRSSAQISERVFMWRRQQQQQKQRALTKRTWMLSLPSTQHLTYMSFCSVKLSMATTFLQRHTTTRTCCDCDCGITIHHHYHHHYRHDLMYYHYKKRWRKWITPGKKKKTLDNILSSK